MNLLSFIQDPFVILFLGLFIVVGTIVFLRANAFFALIAAALTVSFLSANGGEHWASRVGRVTEEFGTTAGKIGILIVMGAIIGKMMTESRAADRIVRSVCRLFGEKRIPAALMGGGFLLSIPVFYDATFYLLLPLAKSVYRKTRKNYLLYLLAVGFGAMISHTMIPPTPGPLLVASELNVSIGIMILVGLLVGGCLVPCALLIATLMNRMNPRPTISGYPDLPFNSDDPEKSSSCDETTSPDGESRRSSSLPQPDSLICRSFDFQESNALPENSRIPWDENDDSAKLPSFWVAILPIFLPVLLIAAASVADIATGKGSTIQSSHFQILYEGLGLLGKPEFALILAAFISVVVYKTTAKVSLRNLETSLEDALTSAGIIILITAAGGAFGAMLRESGIGARIEEVFITERSFSGSFVLIVAFGVASMMKTAQGSSTTAMITTAGIFSALSLPASTLGFHPVYLALTIGIGACVTSWMNDSGFCVFARMSGVSETDSLKSWTLGIAMIGFCGLAIVLVLSRILPLTSLA